MVKKLAKDISLVNNMSKLRSYEAYALLIKDVITDDNDLKSDDNKWIWHCIYVAEASRRIAYYLHLDYNYAMSLGYVHDIGRKISHQGHPILGYQYMCRMGYEEEGRSCLTHSFINNDITLTAGEGPKNNSYLFLKHYLDNHPVDIYDNIVQLCDLFCESSGFTTIEKRLLDITKRKGVTDNSHRHYQAVIELKNKIESMLGCDLYSLFPEIKKEDLDSVAIDREELLRLIDSYSSKKKLLQ